MLISLKIENYALIRSCCIDWKDGFNCITGETGAGKSILLGALSIVLGQRADTQVLLDKEKKCVVEAVFSVGENMQEMFQQNDLDYEKESIFRREITPSGKSRAFINDSPVQLSVMKEFADRLIDIHSQSSTISLREASYQTEIMDSVLDDKSILSDYSSLYRKYQALNKSLEEKRQRLSDLTKEKSYNDFLCEELINAKLTAGEQEELEQSVEIMSHSEEIKMNIFSAVNIMENSDEFSVLTALQQVLSLMGKASGFSGEFSQMHSRIESSLIELKDINSELQSMCENIVYDPQQLQQDTERLNLIYSLEKKHNVTSVEELISIRDSLSSELNSFDSLQEEIVSLEKESKALFKELSSLAEKLHQERLKAAEFLSSGVKPLLEMMSMKDAVLKVDVVTLSELGMNGSDSIKFMFSANKTKDDRLQEMSKVISGGELSRLMLAIKAVVAQRSQLPTMVFDEIDTGISGEAAARTADIMLSLAGNHQLIVITHLVQMAAKAENQYFVYKKNTEEGTESNIELLDREGRVKVIAQMLSGDTVTKEAVSNARSLLK